MSIMSIVGFLFLLVLSADVQSQSIQCEPLTEFCEVKEQCDATRRLVSETCTSAINCPDRADCVAGVCTCAAGYKSTSDRTSCDRIKAKQDEPCADDNNCGENTFCDTDVMKCICFEGYAPSLDRMACNLLSVALDASCLVNEQCGINAACISAVCSCKPGFNKVNSLCVASPKTLDQPCIYDSDCAQGTPNSFCQGVCKCQSGYENKASKCGLLRPLVGGPCAIHANCPLDAFCRGAVCKCHPNFATSIDKRECVFRNSKLGELCNSNGNCESEEFTVCNDVSGLCDCEAGYTAVNGTCILLQKGLGEACTASIQCWDKVFFASCYQGRCDCDPGFVLSKGQCVLVTKNLGESCQISYQCPRHSFCDRECHGQCVCKLGFEERSGQCYQKGSIKDPGDVCDPRKDYCSSNTVCAGDPPKCTSNEKAPARCAATDQPESVLEQCPETSYHAFETFNTSKFRFLCREAAEFVSCAQLLTPGCSKEVTQGLFQKMQEYYAACCQKSGPTASCPLKFNSCSFRPCMHGATCVQLGESFECRCLAGFTGPRCETNIDDCASKPCSSVEKCEDLVNGYKCVCPAGYFGPLCDQKYFQCNALQLSADPRECDYYFVCRGAGSEPDRQRCGRMGAYQKLFDISTKTCLLPSMFKPTSTYKLSPGCEIPAIIP